MPFMVELRRQLPGSSHKEENDREVGGNTAQSETPWGRPEGSIFPVVEYIEITPVLIITLAYEKNPYATSLTSFIACTDELIWSQSWVLFLS